MTMLMMMMRMMMMEEEKIFYRHRNKTCDESGEELK
jgi:hypothetical protein